MRSLLCYIKNFVIEEFVIRVLHCTYQSPYVCTYQSPCVPTNHPVYLPITLCTYQSPCVPTYYPMSLPITLCTYQSPYVPTNHPMYLPTTLCTYQSPYVPSYLPPAVPQPVPENADISGPSPNSFWGTVPPHTAQTFVDSRVAVHPCFLIGIRDLW